MKSDNETLDMLLLILDRRKPDTYVLGAIRANDLRSAILNLQCKLDTAEDTINDMQAEIERLNILVKDPRN